MNSLNNVEHQNEIRYYFCSLVNLKIVLNYVILGSKSQPEIKLIFNLNSDRLACPYGRRRPLMVAGTILLM